MDLEMMVAPETGKPDDAEEPAAVKPDDVELTNEAEGFGADAQIAKCKITRHLEPSMARVTLKTIADALVPPLVRRYPGGPPRRRRNAISIVLCGLPRFLRRTWGNCLLNCKDGCQPKSPEHSAVGPCHEMKTQSAKVRLQILIREFAYSAVGPGLEIDAQSQDFQGVDWGINGSLHLLLRLDRRLSQLELWSPVPGGAAATVVVPLQQISSMTKGVAQDCKEKADAERDILVLTRNEQNLRLVFPSSESRDKAYTCLYVFRQAEAGRPKSEGL